MRDRRHERGIRGFARARAGAVGTEFAFCMPILLLLLFGSIEIGRGLHDFHVVNESVRDAARYLSRVPVTCPAGTVDDANDESAARALAMTGNVNTVGPAPDLLAYWNFPADAATIDVTVACLDNSGGGLAGIYGGSTLVPVVELTANVPFAFLFGEMVVSNANITISISHKVINVGQ